MLSDPRYAGQQIAALAYDAGFNDPSYFVRCFRRQYGLRAIRRAPRAIVEAGEPTMSAIHLRPNGSSPGMPNQPPLLRFSTDMFPERERLAALCEFYGRRLRQARY